MKKILFLFAGLIIILLAALFLFPNVIKGKIVKIIDEQLANQVEATVRFDHDHVSASLLNDFPNLTIGLRDLSIVGKNQFAKDTLLAADEFLISLDILSAFSDRIVLKKIFLDQALISIVFDENGKGNYDLFPEGKASTEPDEESAEAFELAFEHWELNNSRILYKDLMYDMYISMEGVNHTGDGDFAMDIFDMRTYNEISSFSFDYEGVNFMRNKQIVGDLVMNMDLNEWVFRFAENKISINDFAFSFEGFFAMPDEGYDMDIQFKTTDNSFKSFLSLVPGMYAEGFSDLETKGSLAFGGFVKGLYTEDRLPAWDVNVQVKDGYVKSKDMPIPMEQIHLDMRTASKSGELKDGILHISKLAFSLDKEPFSSKIILNNFDNPAWDIDLRGRLNMSTISKLLPSQAFSLSGNIAADLQTKGLLSDVESGQYQKVKSSGQIDFKQFTYSDAEIGTFKLNKAQFAFNPQFISLNEFDANWGNSDFRLKGQLNNYMAYFLKGKVLQGSLSLNSRRMDINEIISISGEETSETTADTTGLAVIAIPENINFSFDAGISRVLYDDYDMRNLRGKIMAKDGQLYLDKVNFGMLGGQINMSGLYDPTDITVPIFSFDLDMQRINIRQAYQSFVSIQKLAPIAEKMEGTFSTQFKIAGLLEENMMPDYSSLTGKGIITVLNAALTDSHIIKGINQLAKFGNKGSDELRMQNVRIKAEIANGRMHFDPFVINIGNYATTVGGSTGIDGSLDYLLAMNVPSGQAGQAFNQAVSGIIGSEFKGGETVVMNFNMAGTYRNPDIKLGKVETAGGSARTAISNTINSKIEEEKAQIKEELDKHRAEAEKKAKEEAERLKKEAAKKAEEEKEKLKEKAKSKIKNLFGDG